MFSKKHSNIGAAARRFSGRRNLSLALSVVLALQVSAPNFLMLCAPAWAAEEMSQDVAPSWNEVKSDSAKVIEAAGKEEHCAGDGKAIAEAAHVSATDTAADAAVIMQNRAPAQVEAKQAEPPAGAAQSSGSVTENSSQTSQTNNEPANAGQINIDQASTQSAAAPVAPVTTGETTATAPATAGETAVSAEAAKTNLVAPAPISSELIAPAPTSSELAAPAPISSELVGHSSISAETSQAPKVGVKGALGTADSLSNDMLRALGATVTATETITDADGTVTEGGVMVMDCDEKEQVQNQIQYENLPTDEGKTHIKAGAVFPVVVSSQISSKTAHKGDAIEARLKYDLKIGDRLIAHKGAEVHGHINYALHARSALHSLVSPERWYRNSGCLGVEFDEIINEKGEHLPLVACPARAGRIIKNKNEGRELGVNHHGQIAGPWSQQLRYKAVRIGLNAAMAPCGVFSFGAMPVALGLIGAANPSFAFMKPVGQNVRHRRLKGFAWGFLSGVPGSWLIEDTVVKGQESVIKPGDEFLAEFRQEFNGEPASEAQLLPNASVKVHGQVSGKSKK